MFLIKEFQLNKPRKEKETTDIRHSRGKKSIPSGISTKTPESPCPRINMIEYRRYIGLQSQEKQHQTSLIEPTNP